MFLIDRSIHPMHLSSAAGDAVGGTGDGGEPTSTPPGNAGGESPVGGSQSIPPPAATLDWKAMRQTLPPAMRDNSILNQFDEGGFEAFVHDRIALDPLIGREKVPLPAKDATPEDLDRFYTALGRPVDAKDYDLGEFKPPEGLPWDESLQKNMMEDFHKAGLTNDQASKIISAYATRQSEGYQQLQMKSAEARGEAELQLKSELGDGYDGFVELAGRAFESAFGENLAAIAEIQMPDGQLFGDHPLIIKAFGNLGKKMAEHGFSGGKQSTVSMSVSPDQAQLEIDKMEHPGSETAKILAQSNHPEHKAVKARWRSLYQAANPER